MDAGGGSNFTTVSDNVCVGHQAGISNGASENTYIGHQAGYNTNAAGNTFVGYRTGWQYGTGTSNVLVGYTAGTAFRGQESVIIGHQAGDGSGTTDLTTSVIIGKDASRYGRGQMITSMGWRAGTYMTGSYNTFIGGFAGYGSATSAPHGTGTANTTLGAYSAYKMTSGGNNVLVGYAAGIELTTGDNNTTLGLRAGDTLTTGGNNTYIGYNADASANDVDDEIVLKAGSDALVGGGTETIRIGVDSDYIVNDFGENATWTHSSDRRIKKDIKDTNLGLEFILKLQPKEFKKKAPSEYPEEFEQYNAETTERKNPDKTHYGFVAQEVKEAMDLVGHSEFPVWSKQNDGMEMLGETELITPLVKAVQELSEKVKQLEAKLSGSI
jgi:hypothetical protein